MNTITTPITTVLVKFDHLHSVMSSFNDESAININKCGNEYKVEFAAVPILEGNKSIEQPSIYLLPNGNYITTTCSYDTDSDNSTGVCLDIQDFKHGIIQKFNLLWQKDNGTNPMNGNRMIGVLQEWDTKYYGINVSTYVTSALSPNDTDMIVDIINKSVSSLFTTGKSLTTWQDIKSLLSAVTSFTPVSTNTIYFIKTDINI